jgi:diguanylate cyclase (GGDEF)-like protein
MNTSTPARELAPPQAAPAENRIASFGALIGGVFRHLSVTIMLAVGIATACGLGALWLLYDIEQDAAVIAQNERTMHKLTDSVARGLESVMIFGSADAVDRYAERLKTVKGIADLRVLRVDGTEAFQDNKTVAAVNARLGSKAFQARERERSVPVYPASSPHLARALERKRSISYYDTDEAGARVMTVLHPLHNDVACQGCHGADDAVRGILKVTMSLASVDHAIKGTRLKTVAAGLGALAAILALTYVLLRLVVVRRVERISGAMNAIVLGDYSTRVPESDRDELGEMARNFNRMAENLLAASSQLHEGQDMMTAVLRSAHEGVVIADRGGDIIMANAAAERMLGKNSPQIVRDGLPSLFDNAALMNGWRASLGDVAEEISYRGRPLQVYVSRIRGPGQRQLGLAILMRDISGEKHLREEVRRLHFTDEQSGAGNARYLEHALAHYWSKARAGGAPIGVLLVSVDTLKEAALAQGTQTAERIVKGVTQALVELLGRGTPLARMSGDTFAAVLAGPAVGNAEQLAEKVLARLHEVHVEGVEVWASAGVAATVVRDADGAGELMRAAGRALAQAIEAGGACVRVAQDPGR